VIRRVFVEVKVRLGLGVVHDGCGSPRQDAMQRAGRQAGCEGQEEMRRRGR